MASLNVWEYVKDEVVHVPMGNLMVQDGVVTVLDFNSGYRTPSNGESAEIARTLRRWAEQIEKSVVESTAQEHED